MPYPTLVADAIERVRRDGLIGSRGPVLTLGATIDDTTTSVTTAETPVGVGPGSILSTGAELMYVQTVNQATKIATVIRGFSSSTAAAHTIGDVVEIDARFPGAALIDYAENEIKAWGTELWRTTSLDLPVTGTSMAYDLAGAVGEIYFLLDVRVDPGAGSHWSADQWPHADARLLRDLNTTDFPSGFTLQFLDYPRFATTARVTFAQPFTLTAFDLSTDLVADVGLEPAWVEIVEMGMRLRALASSGVARTDWRVSGIMRDGETATVFDLLRTLSVTQAMRDQLFAKAASDLRSRHPFRRGS